MPAVSQAAFAAALLPNVVYNISQSGAAVPAYDITGSVSQGAAFDSGPLGRPNLFLPTGTYTLTPVSAAGQAVTITVPSSNATLIGGNILSTGSVPGAAAGANAGTSPPVPVVTAGATNVRGNITFGTGTTPAAGAQVVVTFATAYPAGTVPLVQLTWGNNGSTALGAPAATAVSATGFTVNCQTAPAASQANTTYSVNYTVID